MALTTPYELPFGVLLPGEGQLAADASFSLDVLAPTASKEMADALGSVLTAWEQLASVGALCGMNLPASESGVGDISKPALSTGRITWTLANVRLDDRAAVVLAHMLATEWEEQRFARLNLYKSDDATGAEPLRLDPRESIPYPGRDRTIEFEVERPDEPMGDVGLAVLFAAAPDDEEKESIRASLSTWAGVTACGAYGVAPNPPLRCGLSFDPDDIEIAEEELTWALAKFRAHPGALDGLANTFAALAQTGTPVRSLVVR